MHANNIVIESESLKPYLIDFGTSCLSGRMSSHRRDAMMLYELSLQIMPEIEDVCFVVGEKIKWGIVDEGSEIVRTIMYYVSDMALNIQLYKSGELDDLGIKGSLVLPIKELENMCERQCKQFVLDKELVDEYFINLGLDKEYYRNYLA